MAKTAGDGEFAFGLIRFSMLEHIGRNWIPIAPSPGAILIQLLVNAPFCRFLIKLLSEANETFLISREDFKS